MHLELQTLQSRQQPHDREARPGCADFLLCQGAHLDVAVITKCRSGRVACSAFTMASLPTPLGPLMTSFTGSTFGICISRRVIRGEL